MTGFHSRISWVHWSTSPHVVLVGVSVCYFTVHIHATGLSLRFGNDVCVCVSLSLKFGNETGRGAQHLCLRTSTLHRYSCVCVTMFSAMPLQYLLKVAQPTGVGRRHIRKVAAYHNNCVHFHIKDTYVG